MASRVDEHLSLMPNFDTRFDLNFNQQDLEWGLDQGFPVPSWKISANNSENTCPITGSTDGSRDDSGSTTGVHFGQADNYLDMSIDNANMLSDMTWQLGTGFSTNASERLSVAQCASGDDVTTGSLKIGHYDFSEKSTMPARKPLVSRPFSTPSSRISRSYQLKTSVTHNAAIGTSKKVNSIQKRKSSTKKFLPMELISHLEDDFQSNSTVSRDFKRKSSEILRQLKQLIDHEKLHGSSGATMFLSLEEHTDDDRTSTGSADMCSSTNLSFNMSALDSGYETHLGSLASASTSAQCTKTHSLASRRTNTKTIYQCTFPECVKSFMTFHDWKRHEEIEKHWLQKRYMCLECDITIADPENSISCAFCSVSLPSLDDAKIHSLQCQDAKENNKTFARKDKFRDHLRDEHMIPNIRDSMEYWTFAIESNWPRRCGFCSAIFRRWEERAAHIEEHYKRGARITAWKLPFPSGDDSTMQNFGPDHENDSDDNRQGNQDRSSMQSYGYDLGGWPGHSSSAVRGRKQGNSSVGTDSEQQYQQPTYEGDNAHQLRQAIDNARNSECRSVPWSEKEDNYLLELVHSKTKRNWARIANLIGSHTSRQCRDRYHETLKPLMTNDPIKPEHIASPKQLATTAQRLHERESQPTKGGSFNRSLIHLVYHSSNSRAKSTCSGSPTYSIEETRGSKDRKTNDNSTSPHAGLYQNPAVGLDGLYHCPWEGKDTFCSHKPELLKSSYLKFVKSHLMLYSCKFSVCNSSLFPSFESLHRHEVEVHTKNRDKTKTTLCRPTDWERGLPRNKFSRHWNMRDYGLKVRISSLECLACSDLDSPQNIMSLDFARTRNITIQKRAVDKRYISTQLGTKVKPVGRAYVRCSLFSESWNSAAKGYCFHILAASPDDLVLGKPFLQDFDILRCLRKGPHGTVDVVRHKTTLVSMARKTLKLSQNSDSPRKRHFLNEISMLNELKRWSMVHIVELEGVYTSKESLSLLMLPVAQCNLEDYMAETDKSLLTTKRRLDLFHWQSCLLSALACLHEHKINHRDISPTNILITDDEIFLSGFGLAVTGKSNAAISTQSEIEHEDFSCTSRYCAPEVASSTSNELPADVFSMGCVLLEMSIIVHGMRMKDLEERLTNRLDSKAYHRNLKPMAKWINHLVSQSQKAVQIWESVLGGRQNCKEYGVALRRRLNVIQAMLSESPSRRPAATVLIPIFDTKSFLSVRDSCLQACNCKPTTSRIKSPPPCSNPAQGETRLPKSNPFALKNSKESLSAIKLEVQDARRSMVTLPKRDLDTRSLDPPTPIFTPPKKSPTKTESSLQYRTAVDVEFALDRPRVFADTKPISREFTFRNRHGLVSRSVDDVMRA